jgi:ribonuclease D
MIIEANEQLIDICDKASHCQYVAFDTEFVRKKGFYYPEPSLVQFSYDGKQGFICDTLNSKLDLQPLIDLLTRNDVIKIFHSARQDLQVLHKLFGIKPRKIFDVQTASMFLGYSTNPSYDRLVKTFLGTTLDKQLQFSDWMFRPLSAKHIDYAERDVTYLYRLFPKIREALGEMKYKWVNEEMNHITPVSREQELNDMLENLALKIVNKKRSLNPRYLCLLKIAVKWREEYSLQNNMLRNNVIESDTLYEFIFKVEKKFDSLDITKLPKSKIQRLILKTIKDKIDLVDNFDEFQTVIESIIKRRNVMRDKKNSLYPSLQSLLQECSQHHLIHQSLIAQKKDLVKIAAENCLTNKFQHGWRYEAFGSKAEGLFSS